MSDKYRRNVGIVVAKGNKVLLCARADKRHMAWQFPQGGIEEGEEIVAAARRELEEETALKDLELIAVMPKALRYDFPAGDKVHCFGDYKGQEQSWVLFRFSGNDEEINFCLDPDAVEFKAFEWADIFEAPERIIAFKQDVYRQVAEYFAPYLQGDNHD